LGRRLRSSCWSPSQRAVLNVTLLAVLCGWYCRVALTYAYGRGRDRVCGPVPTFYAASYSLAAFATTDQRQMAIFSQGEGEVPGHPARLKRGSPRLPFADFAARLRKCATGRLFAFVGTRCVTCSVFAFFLRRIHGNNRNTNHYHVITLKRVLATAHYECYEMHIPELSPVPSGRKLFNSFIVCSQNCASASLIVVTGRS
jgi:hypothetical protein